MEVKPKWGGLPTSPCVHPDNSLKLHSSKFQLQQALKLSKVHALRVTLCFGKKSLSTEQDTTCSYNVVTSCRHDSPSHVSHAV